MKNTFASCLCGTYGNRWNITNLCKSWVNFMGFGETKFMTKEKWNCVKYIIDIHTVSRSTKSNHYTPLRNANNFKITNEKFIRNKTKMDFHSDTDFYCYIHLHSKSFTALKALSMLVRSPRGFVKSIQKVFNWRLFVLCSLMFIFSYQNIDVCLYINVNSFSQNSQQHCINCRQSNNVKIEKEKKWK